MINLSDTPLYLMKGCSNAWQFANRTLLLRRSASIAACAWDHPFVYAMLIAFLIISVTLISYGLLVMCTSREYGKKRRKLERVLMTIAVCALLFLAMEIFLRACSIQPPSRELDTVLPNRMIGDQFETSMDKDTLQSNSENNLNVLKSPPYIAGHLLFTRLPRTVFKRSPITNEKPLDNVKFKISINDQYGKPREKIRITFLKPIYKKLFGTNWLSRAKVRTWVVVKKALHKNC